MRNMGVKLQAFYVPGSITIDGLDVDWSSVKRNSFALNPALTDDPDTAYPSGSMEIKVAHDGRDIFFLLQIPGAYKFDVNEKNMAAISLMFPVGDDATYHNMGGCPEASTTCNATSCFGHEVDLLHFEINQAIPGRLYGENIADSLNGTGRDSFGKLNDGYAWNPHCRSYDGMTPTGVVTGGGQNNWRGSWTHSTTDTKYGLVAADSPYGALDGTGTYTFEFARPLRTNDALQQDVQFTIGSTHGMSAAFWYPVAGSAWMPYQHYSVSCDWLQLEIITNGPSLPSSSKLGSALSVFSLLFALASLAVAVTVGWRIRQSSRIAFNPISSSSL
ncbi:uncharacterized protein [Physcomitrium patens]|nr:uncharacterized protein LOC112292786 isoform X2 [Physcomitrium patens]|eukprot:XP_024397372.1 uncharacterized protein LOC112292786 isoform X2 [Physcomitrella patens]